MKSSLPSRWPPITVVLTFIVALSFPAPAGAGEETFTITYTNDVPYVRSVDLGEKRVARIAEHILIARNDADKGFMHNTAALCIVGFLDEPDKPREGNGYCTFRDEDGDSIFERYNYSDASSGQVTVLGGTGKYAGVTCKGEWKKLATPKSPVEGKWQNIGRKTITCNMP